MPLTTVAVTGTIGKAIGSTHTSGVIRFQLDRFDVDTSDGQVITADANDANVSASGEISINLWPNDRGAFASRYNVYHLGETASGDFTNFLGKISIPESGAPHDFDDLLASGEPTPEAVYIGIITQEQYDDALAAVADAEAAQAAAEAAQAAAEADADRTETNALSVVDRAYFAEVSDLKSDNGVIIDYSGGSAQFTVAEDDYITAGGFRYQVAAPGASDEHLTTAGGVKLYRVDRQVIEVLVGSGGDYSNITDALSFLSNQQRSHESGGVSALIQLVSGFTMNEQIIVDDGIDLSWITITSVDAEVSITRSAITQSTTSLGGGFASIGAYKAAFMGGGGARMPRLGCKMRMDTSGTADDQSGIFLTHGAFMEVLPGCGIDDTVANGAHLMYGAKLVAPLSEWDGNGTNTSGDAKGAIRADWQSTVSAQEAVVTNQGVSGIIILGASTASVRDATITTCGEDGLEVGGCSIVHARGVDISGCSRHALFAGEGCAVRLIQSSLTDSLNGIWAELGARVNSASGTVITGHTNYGVRANSGAQVVLSSATISASLRPTYCDGAEIQLISSSATGGSDDLYVDNGGIIHLNGVITTSSGNTLANNIADSNVSAFNTPAGTERSMIYGRGGRSQSRGGASIASGNTSVTVTHNIDSNFGLLPEEISVIPADADAAALDWYVTNVTSTTFDIVCLAAPSGQADFEWNARKILI